MTPQPFGTLPDGRTVQRVTLRDGRLIADVLTLGATVQALWLAGVPHSLVLGAADVADYLGSARYFGSIVGRFANRIGGARFMLDGTQYRTDPNFRARHTLHGGSDGTDVQLWQIAALAPDRVTLTLTLADGHMGFPGTLDITALIALEDGALCIDLWARTDAPTPCSLAHHGFFDLDGRGDIRDHRLTVAADHYLPVDADLIPTGDIAPVAGTAFDFCTPRRIGADRYDHNFCLSDAPQPLRPVARLSGENGISMQVETTAPGLQVYDGAYIDDVAGLEGRHHRAHAGIALETQGWPDAPNRAQFPGAILRPGQTYRQTTRYRFDA